MTSKREHYRRYAARHAGGIDATFVRFVMETGKWLTGKVGNNPTELNGKQFLADTGNLLEGYRKFPREGEASRAPIWAVTMVSSGKLVDRAALGDLDETKWELSKFSDERRNPWQPVSCVGLIVPEEPYDVWAFVAENPSGATAIAQLMDAMVARLDPIDELPDPNAPASNGHCREDEVPLVALENRPGGGPKGLFSPVLRIVRWQARPATARILRAPPLPLPPTPRQQDDFFEAMNRDVPI
jgi:hypothetical protein